MTSDSDALARRLSGFFALSAEESMVLQRLQGPRIFVESGKELVHEGQHQHSAYVLCSGWAYSYKGLRDGQRQIIDIQMAGDLLGIRSLLLTTSDQSIVPLTDVEVRKINTERLSEVFRSAPRVALALLWAISRDEAMMVEHLVSLGKRDAATGTVHMLLELGARAELVGLGTQEGFGCPISQNILADSLGITPIHLNRVLRQLRESKLLVFKDGLVTFLDRKRLIEFFEMDFAYLNQDIAVKRR
ncbi:Crp/Fnr family transcriptional regulator [Mesorhizobium sp. BH1-1-4]|uniref:Crp/Fnr family transcriptional regulator n=1 Tax=Mesorhizobium sp. BH1-1-4 TaxID=2876662 RepID=UPI001CD11FC3|nr:Crp/Fnr family transcriptional regulator [Mesorhizobium sp. BH1-1-4]MBZ9993103.1 Crp/Fnr family transcriptional regulator [Mesorhizobium sp. BH1-1-4]